jgi:hypothetical protein
MLIKIVFILFGIFQIIIIRFFKMPKEITLFIYVASILLIALNMFSLFVNINVYTISIIMFVIILLIIFFYYLNKKF